LISVQIEVSKKALKASSGPAAPERTMALGPETQSWLY